MYKYKARQEVKFRIGYKKYDLKEGDEITIPQKINVGGLELMEENITSLKDKKKKIKKQEEVI